MLNDDVHDSCVIHKYALAWYPSTRPLAFPIFFFLDFTLLRLIVVTDHCFVLVLLALFLLALAHGLFPACSVLLSLLLLHIRYVLDLSEEFGQNILGRQSYVDVSICEVFP